jgi:hypothetical protein
MGASSDPTGTDWAERGWDLDQTIAFAKALAGSLAARNYPARDPAGVVTFVRFTCQ